MPRTRPAVAFFIAPLPIIIFMVLSPAMGLGSIGGLRSTGDLAIQLSMFWFAELISVLPIAWYVRRTGRAGYWPFALGTMLVVMTISGYFTYKGMESLQSLNPGRYEPGAIRSAVFRGLAVSAIYGVVVGICFRAIAGRPVRRRSEIDHLRERFE